MVTYNQIPADLLLNIYVYKSYKMLKNKKKIRNKKEKRSGSVLDISSKAAKLFLFNILSYKQITAGKKKQKKQAF